MVETPQDPEGDDRTDREAEQEGQPTNDPSIRSFQAEPGTVGQATEDPGAEQREREQAAQDDDDEDDDDSR